ncbi:MAG: glycosyltransferase family 4 protein [Minisyncoccota bacterium]
MPRSKKILFVITKGTWGGAQRYVYDLAAAAQGAANEVVVACGEPGELAEHLRLAGIRTVAVRGLSRDVGILREFFAFFGLLRLFTRERPDIVHLNSSKAGVIGCIAARLTKIPHIIFTAHGWAFNEARPWWQRAVLYLASGIIVLFSHETICVSEAVKRDIGRFPFLRSKLVVIRLGIDCPPRLSREEARAALGPYAIGRYWVGMISELHPTKRIADAIRAFGTFVKTHPEAILVVIGAGQERERLESLVRDLHMRDHVSFAGFREDAAALLGAFDLFIHASRSEALGYAVLEAGCAALPVVATRVGGIPEIILDDGHGLLVQRENPAALAVAMESLIQDPRRAAELGARLHARVTGAFSKERMISETFACYAR